MKNLVLVPRLKCLKPIHSYPWALNSGRQHGEGLAWAVRCLGFLWVSRMSTTPLGNYVLPWPLDSWLMTGSYCPCFSLVDPDCVLLIFARVSTLSSFPSLFTCLIYWSLFYFSAMMISTNEVEATSSLNYNLTSSSMILSKEQSSRREKNHGTQEATWAPAWKKNSFFAH